MSLNLGRAGKGTGASSASGAAYGVDFIHQVGINVGLGLSLDYLKPADKTSDSLIKNARASTSIDSASFLGVVRVGSVEDAFQPNVELGLGVHYTSIKLDAAPAPGFGWIDTGTNEKRSLIDGAGWGPAIKFQMGANYGFTDNAVAGAFLAINWLGTASYDATGQAKAMGLNSVSGSMMAITFGVNAIARF